MPTYEYKCLSCGINFDAFQKMSESPLDTCIKCKGSVQRVVSGGNGLIFKGKGFYITDYKNKNTGDGKKTKEVGSGKKETSK